MKYALNLEPESVGDAFEMNELEDEATDSFSELEGNLDHECESCSEFDTELGETEWEDEIRRGHRMSMRPAGLRPAAYRRPGPSGKPKPRGNYQFHKPAGKPRRWPRGVITAPHVCTCPAPNCPRHGSEYVRWVQSALNQIMNLRLAVTGIMNAATRSALRSFQEKQGLPVDGIAGPESRDALIGAKGGKSPRGDDTKPIEPSIAEPAEPVGTKPASELGYRWESGLDPFEINFDEFEDTSFKSISTISCQAYQRGEVVKSRTLEGYLPFDIIKHPRGLLIADFGVNWRTPKNSVKNEPLLKEWLQTIMQLLNTNPTIKIRILGFSDCVGKEKNNILLRRGRAQKVYQLLYKLLEASPQWKVLKPHITFIGSAPKEDYIADNATVEGRAKNRGVVIEHQRTVSFEPEDVRQLACDNRIHTVTLWLNAFIPKDVPGLTKKVPDKFNTIMAGKTMFDTAFGCGLTDQRSFSTDKNASSRMHSEVKIDLDTQRIIDEKHRIDPSIQIACKTGKITCNRTSSTKPMKFTFRGVSPTKEIMVHIKGSQGPACPVGIIGTATKKVGQFLLNAKIDYEGTFFIKRLARNYVQVSFIGYIDLFPAYEFVVMLNNSNPVHLGGKLPPPGSSPVTHLGSKGKVHFSRKIWLKCDKGKEVAGSIKIIN